MISIEFSDPMHKKCLVTILGVRTIKTARASDLI